MFTSVLMIEKPLSSVDVEFVTTLHGDESVSFIVLMQPRGDQADALLRAIDDVAMGALKDVAKEGEELSAKDGRRPVEIALERSVQALRDAGCEAVGQVVEDHPLDKMKAVVEESEADEVIVLTAPHYVEEFFHRDWASRARHKVGVPVLKLFAHNE
ncbi:indole-3-glycerol phosphate synthase [Streptomyces sp. TRM64462]|uniref:indole-3-glycerol phosphate synthase n=1 Tax=Streptomyces sp. TRM64462 TaxID=2741726 RepID=UPI0015867208|nr:indole-3-glycerol phosphate synthase [Streptomyces sp. TRM64462]